MSKAYLREELISVQDSALHGKGLFAAQDIEQGTEIGRCKTRRVNTDGAHVLWIDDDGLEKHKVLCDLRFINHSKQPNVAYYDDLTVVALEPISAGSELLHDYGDEWA